MTEHLAVRPGLHSSLSDDLSDKSFDLIAAIAYERAGLLLSRSKKNMVKSRIVRRLRALCLTSFETYSALVSGADGEEECGHLIGALTTNVSSFFRENHHFESLRQQVLPPLIARLAKGGKLRIWSAGCSNGQEPYSIAMVLKKLEPRIHDRDARILATDIDRNVLNFARDGTYPSSMLEGVAAEDLAQFFDQAAHGSGQVRVKPEIGRLITFNMLNLHAEWEMRGPFDVIFCRNVMIYFDGASQKRLISRFHDILAPGGTLMLGHSERVPAEQAGLFQNAGITTLRKPVPERG